MSNTESEKRVTNFAPRETSFSRSRSVVFEVPTSYSDNHLELIQTESGSIAVIGSPTTEARFVRGRPAVRMRRRAPEGNKKRAPSQKERGNNKAKEFHTKHGYSWKGAGKDILGGTVATWLVAGTPIGKALGSAIWLSGQAILGLEGLALIGALYTAAHFVPGFGGAAQWLTKKVYKYVIGQWLKGFAPEWTHRMELYIDDRINDMDKWVNSIEYPQKGSGIIPTMKYLFKRTYMFYKHANAVVSYALSLQGRMALRNLWAIFDSNESTRLITEEDQRIADEDKAIDDAMLEPKPEETASKPAKK